MPSLIPRQEVRYLNSSNSSLQPSPLPAPTQPGPSAAPPTLQPDPTCLAQIPMSRTSAQLAAPCCGPLRLGFRLTPSAVVPETQPVTPPASSEQDRQWSCGAIHPAVNAMTALSDPHPLNILADISSAAPKSPVKWVQTLRASSQLNVQKTIAKSAGAGKGGAGAVGNLYLGSSTAATAGHRTAASLGKASTLRASQCKASKSGAAAGNDGRSSSLPKGSEPSSKPTITCSQCSSSFTERFNLNKHIRAVHERRRPYQCQTCLARFQQRDHMQKHEMCVHKKLRQFSCDACGASFGWRGVLKKHRKSVHGIHE
jgi:Zinc finger, C2H2 type